MTPFQRQVGMFILLVSLLTPLSLPAQENDNTAITVVGSGIVAPLFDALAESAGVNITATVTGTNSGLEIFCQGEADMTTANRPITVEEEAACQQALVNYREFLLGHHIIAFIVNPQASFVQCLAPAELNTLFAPSAEGQTVNWNQVNVEYADTPLSLYLPPQDTSAYALLDSLVEGAGLRADVGEAGKNSDTDIVAAVAVETGAIGVVNLSAALEAGDSIRILDLNNAENAGCAAPSAENVENRLYSGAERLFLYVNDTSQAAAGVQTLLDTIVSENAAETVAKVGFVPPTAEAYATNREILQDNEGGRQFSRDVTNFTIPADVSGEVSIGGAANGFAYMQAITQTLSQTAPTLVTTLKIEGEPAGFRRLCNGEIDLALAYNDLSAEVEDNCAANNISTVTFNLGSQATVLVANQPSDYLACLTTEQLQTIWSARSAETVTTWNQVDESFPETQMTLFAPEQGDSYSDLMMIEAAGVDDPVRPDVAEKNDDALYRAAATANVEGALTFMSWGDYQRVLENHQVNIQLVAVDSGSGCVQPSEDTIADGSYALSRPLNLIANQVALSRTEVQSLLWFMASEENYSALVDAGFVGVSFGDLPALRDRLQSEYSQAAVQAAIIAEMSPEPGAESTEEATAEATEAAQ